MADPKSENPLPPCPVTPNCYRSSVQFETGIERVFDALVQLFEQNAHSFEVTDPKRITVNAVYRIPFFGFKDDVDVILEEDHGTTRIYLRSASRVGAYDLGVNKRRVKRIISVLSSMIQ